MSEMVERVAKAMCERSGADWSGASDDPYSPPPINRVFWRLNARAAIEAMREPTAEMNAAVENDDVIQCGLDDCNKHDIPVNAWRLMIDAALTSPASKGRCC